MWRVRKRVLSPLRCSLYLLAIISSISPSLASDGFWLNWSNAALTQDDVDCITATHSWGIMQIHRAPNNCNNCIALVQKFWASPDITNVEYEIAVGNDFTTPIIDIVNGGIDAAEAASLPKTRIWLTTAGSWTDDDDANIASMVAAAQAVVDRGWPVGIGTGSLSGWTDRFNDDGELSAYAHGWSLFTTGNVKPTDYSQYPGATTFPSWPSADAGPWLWNGEADNPQLCGHTLYRAWASEPLTPPNGGGHTVGSDAGSEDVSESDSPLTTAGFPPGMALALGIGGGLTILGVAMFARAKTIAAQKARRASQMTTVAAPAVDSPPANKRASLGVSTALTRQRRDSGRRASGGARGRSRSGSKQSKSRSKSKSGNKRASMSKELRKSGVSVSKASSTAVVQPPPPHSGQVPVPM